MRVNGEYQKCLMSSNISSLLKFNASVKAKGIPEIAAFYLWKGMVVKEVSVSWEKVCYTHS